MKRLTLMRHAKSDWGDPSVSDLERPLNERGRQAARRVGQELGRRHFRFDAVLASPAQRVRETIAGMQDMLSLAPPPRFDPSLYLAAEALLLTLVRQLPQSVEQPLIIGHNPGLHRLTLSLAQEEDGALYKRIEDNLPTGAVAVIDLAVEEWVDVEPGSGRLADLILPWELA